MGTRKEKALLVEEMEEFDQEAEAPAFDQPMYVEVGEDFEEEDGLALMMRKTLLMPKCYTKEEEMKQKTKDPVYNQPLNEEIIGEFKDEGGLALVMNKILLVLKKETKENWLRTKFSILLATLVEKCAISL